MFKNLKNRIFAANDSMPAIATSVSKLSVNRKIEEIHETFYTEVDKLLASAKITNSLDTDKQNLIEKSERLKVCGFTSTKEMNEASLEVSRLDILKKENESKSKLIEAINYFSFKYPNYKFITEASVKRICEKYGLIYGNVSDYIGTVPDNNLKHIEDFRIDEEDDCYVYTFIYSDGWNKNLMEKGFRTKDDSEKKVKDEIEKSNTSLASASPLAHHYSRMFNADKCQLEIAAPIKDFDMKGKEVKNYKVSDIPDPIVLKPVIYKDVKHYLIVTAWGLEAEDGLVINERHN